VVVLVNGSTVVRRHRLDGRKLVGRKVHVDAIEALGFVSRAASVWTGC
jgi:hypothetical protein